MSYTLQQEHQTLRLIKQRRKQLQDDREALRKIGVINFKNKYQIKGIKLNQETIKKLRIGG